MAKNREFPIAWTKAASEGEEVDHGRVTVVARTLMQESDRGCAIFGAAILDGDLEALLRAFCRTDEASVKQVVDEIFKGYAPLASFSAKIQVTFALRLITQNLRQKLDLVRRLRNDFAHEPGPLTFAAPECGDRLRALLAGGKPVSERLPKLKGHIVNRVAFIIEVAKMSARIAYIRDQAEAGRDPRVAVERLEAKGR